MDRPPNSGVRLVTAGANTGKVQVAVSGDLDYVTAALLLGGLLAILKNVPMTVLDLDLSAVGFCDCAGLGALVTVRDAAARSGIGVTISAAHPGTVWLLERTGLNRYLGYSGPPDRAPSLIALGAVIQTDDLCGGARSAQVRAEGAG